MLYLKVEQIFSDVDICIGKTFSLNDLMDFCEKNKLIPVPNEEGKFEVYSLQEQLMFTVKYFDEN